jgi:hypothetical protein
MNRKKFAERERLNSFLRCTARSDFPEPEEGESPDFLFHLGDHTLGIEVTGIVSPRIPGGDNPRQSSRTLERLADTIRRCYETMGGPRSHVSIFPRERVRVSQVELPGLAQVLAATIVDGLANVMNDYPLQQPWRLAIQHPVVRSIAAWHCAPDEQARWHVHRGGMVDGANAEDILATLGGKEPKLAQYRTKANEVWLLVVCDMFSEGLFIDPPTEPVPFAVRTGFDRVFCLEWTGTRAVEIPLDTPRTTDR